jgi:hypothetical protein
VPEFGSGRIVQELPVEGGRRFATEADEQPRHLVDGEDGAQRGENDECVQASPTDFHGGVVERGHHKHGLGDDKQERDGDHQAASGAEPGEEQVAVPAAAEAGPMHQDDQADDANDCKHGNVF